MPSNAEVPCLVMPSCMLSDTKSACSAMPNLLSPAQSACSVMPIHPKPAYLPVPTYAVAACLLWPSGVLDAHTACPFLPSLGVRKGERSSRFLFQEVPGRLWDGKEVILEALGELIVVAPHCIQPEEDVITAILGVPLCLPSTFCSCVGNEEGNKCVV